MKVKEIIKNFVIIILIFIFIEICYSKFAEKEYPVKLFGNSFLIVSTGSMEPTINSGELIIISNKEEYKIDDIVTYIDKDGFLITHRIVDCNNENIVTKGDNNDLNDEETSKEKIIGKVVFHSKLIGFFVQYILKPLIIVYIFILIFMSFIEIYVTKNERNEEIYEKNKVDAND